MEPTGKRRGARPLRRFMNAAQGRHGRGWGGWQRRVQRTGWDRGVRAAVATR